jgi:hypothetical protein
MDDAEHSMNCFVATDYFWAFVVPLTLFFTCVFWRDIHFIACRSDVSQPDAATLCSTSHDVYIL